MGRWSILCTAMYIYNFALQYFPLISFILYLLLSNWIIHRFPLGGHRSVSEHIAHSGNYYRLSSVFFSIIALGLSANLLLWIAPLYNATTGYLVIVVFLFLSGIGLAWFPADIAGSKRPQHLLHLFSVLLLYTTIIALSIVSFFATTNAAPLAHIFTQWTLVIFIWLIGLYLFYKPSHNHFVFYETVAISTFFVLLILLSLGI